MSFPMDDVKSTISDLPEEVLLEVFSYLTHFDIYQNVRNVCVGWKHLSECACLWNLFSHVYTFPQACAFT